MSEWTSSEAREFLAIIRDEAAKVYKDMTAKTSVICTCLAVVITATGTGAATVRLLTSPSDGSQDFVASNPYSISLTNGNSVWLHYWGDYTNSYIALKN